MKFAKKMFNLEKAIYKKELQKFNQDQWGEPIDVMVLIYSNDNDLFPVFLTGTKISSVRKNSLNERF